MTAIFDALTDAYRNFGYDVLEACDLAHAAIAALDPHPAGWWCHTDAHIGAPGWQPEPCETCARGDSRVWVLRNIKEHG